MGRSSVRALCLAVLVLACLSQSGWAAKRATTTSIEQTTYMTYSSDPSLASGGIFADFASAPEQVFLWTVNPGVPFILSWNMTQLLTESDVSFVQLANASHFSESDTFFRFYTAQTDGQYMYVASSRNVFKFDPSDVAQIAQNATLPETQPDPTASLRLSNGTDDIMVITSIGSTDLAVVDLISFPAVSTYVLEGTPANEDGAGATISVRDDYGFLVYSLDTSIMLYRIGINRPSLEPELAIEIQGLYAPNAAPSYIDTVDNILYFLCQDSDATRPVLVALNLTAVDSGTGSIVLDASLPATAREAQSVGVYGDAIRAIFIEDPDNLAPLGTALEVDLVGGQIFVMLDAGLVMRVNMKSFELVTPSLLVSGDSANPSGRAMKFFGDATSSEGHRTLLSWTKLTIVTAQMGSACPLDCGEASAPVRGTCVAGTCECTTGFHGVDCAGLECTSLCGEPDGHGTCGVSGQCVCNADYSFESNCTQRQCPSACFGNGDCNDDFTCTCNPLWAGADCSIAAFLACDTFVTESACVAKFGACGWCTDTKLCQSGNLDGPYQGTCKGWYTGGKEQVGLLAAAIVLFIIFGLMLLVGIFSAMPMDYVTASILVDSSLLTTDFLKEAYWRDERSAKTWKMFDLFQFISFYSFLNVSFPTQLIQFSRYFHWANLMIPMPYGHEVNNITHPNRLPTSNTPTAAAVSSSMFQQRDILNVEQYANSVKLDTESIFYGTMFWFAILVGICLVIYAVYALVMWLCLRRKEPNITAVLMQKVFYLLTRLVLIGYMPINFTAAWHIREGARPHRGSIAAAVFAIIIFGILPIAFNAVVVWNKGKELLFLYLKLRFGALYSVLHYEKARFHLVVLLRKLAIALFLGFLAAPSTSQSKYAYAQVFTIIGCYIIYMVLLVVVRPYLDQVHLVLDLVMCTLFGVAVGVALLHRKEPSTAGQIVAGVCIILVFLACLLAFIHSWWNIIGRNTYPWIMCGPKYSGLDDNKSDDGENEEMDTAQAIKQKKAKEAALAGVMPSNKPGKQGPADDSDPSDDVDSSLQSSSSDNDEEEDAPAEEEAPVEESENDSETSEPEESSDNDEDDDEESEESDE